MMPESRHGFSHDIMLYLIGILDFYCPPRKLAVEFDGAAHDGFDQIQHDMRRDGWLERQGLMVLRFLAADVLSAAPRLDVLARIAAAGARP